MSLVLLHKVAFTGAQVHFRTAELTLMRRSSCIASHLARLMLKSDPVFHFVHTCKTLNNQCHWLFRKVVLYSAECRKAHRSSTDFLERGLSYTPFTRWSWLDELALQGGPAKVKPTYFYW